MQTVAQSLRVIGVLLRATWTNASNNCAASNAAAFKTRSAALMFHSNGGSMQPFVSSQKQTVLLFLQRPKAKNQLMSHRSADPPLKENTALIVSALLSLDAL